jgi:phospholipase/carboxylesterase
MLPPASGGAPGQLMVLLHGYGADGADLIGLARPWQALWPDMLVVAPNAPDPCALNPAGYQWFPLSGEPIVGRVAGAEAARPVIVQFLEDLWAQSGLGAADTVLGGFSQGAMMALHVGTSLTTRLRAVVAFSGAFPPARDVATGGYAKPPVALIHGELDRIVDPQLSRDAARELTQLGFDVALHISPGTAHGIAPDGLDFATSFLVAQIPLKA